MRSAQPRGQSLYFQDGQGLDSGHLDGFQVVPRRIVSTGTDLFTPEQQCGQDRREFPCVEHGVGLQFDA